MTKNEVIETIRTWIQTIDDEYDIEEQGRVYGLMEALELIKQIEPEPKWIPVSEGLPEPDYVKKVIVTMENRNKNFSTIANYREVTIRGEKIRRWEWNDRVNFPWEVIAWMPLPQPYEPQESEVSE